MTPPTASGSSVLLEALAALPGRAIGEAVSAAAAIRAALGPEYRVFGWYARLPAAVWDDSYQTEAAGMVRCEHVAWHGPDGWNACAVNLPPESDSWATIPWYVRTAHLSEAVDQQTWGPQADLFELIAAQVSRTSTTESGKVYNRSWTGDDYRAMMWGLLALMTSERRAQLATWLALTSPVLLTDPEGLFPPVDEPLSTTGPDADSVVVEYLPAGGLQVIGPLILPSRAAP